MTVGVGQHLEDYRSLRDHLEASVLERATSVDGRSFEFQAPLQAIGRLVPGGYAVLGHAGGERLAHVLSIRVDEVDAGEVGWDAAGDAPEIRSRMTLRAVRGYGTILTRGGGGFHDATIRVAEPAEIAAWIQEAGPAGARLPVGALTLAPEVPFALDAAGFDRHTFFCGQSGSGKTYSLGVVLEQLLLETSLQIVVLDPNSDFARLREVRAGVDEPTAERWRAVAEGIDVRSAGGERRLHLRLDELDRAAHAAMLRLDPVADREEYAELGRLFEEARPETIGDIAATTDPHARMLALRINNLGADRWAIWSRGEAGSAITSLANRESRCLVLDLGSLGTREEQALVAEAVLSTLWARRAERRPVLIVIDEAHNVCPAEPADALTALATEHAVRIAAEGRKFGLYLLVCTQRPQKVAANVVSQCDNLVLMRMASAADLAYVGDVLSYAPRDLLAGATAFRLGEALAAGKLTSHPALIRFGRRVAEEGGADVDATWATTT